MTDALTRQVDALAGDLRALLEPTADQVRRVLSRYDAGQLSDVYLTASGDSYHASCAAELAVETLGAVACEPLSAHRFEAYGAEAMRLRPGRPLVVVTSASGRSPRVVAAAHAARAHGAITVAITGYPDSPLAQACNDRIVVAPPGLEPGPGVRTYQASLLALLLLAIELGERRGAPSDAGALRAELAGTADLVEATAEAVAPRCAEAAGEVASAPAVLVVGSGPGYGTALFAAAKLVEAGGFAAAAQDLEEWWHVERRIVPAEAPLIVIVSPGRSYPRAMAVAAAARRLGRRVIAVAPSGVPGAAHVLPVVGDVREEFAPLVYQVFAGLLASAATRHAGRPLFPRAPAGLPATLDAFVGTD